MMMFGAEPDALTGARATLVVLRATLTGQAAPALREDAVLVLPDLQLMTYGDVETFLAEIEKPVSCVAVPNRDRLTFGCWPWKSPGDEFFFDLLEISQAVLRERRSAGKPREALVRGAQKQVRLTFPQYEQWLKDYRFPLASINVRVPESGEGLTSDLIFTTSGPAEGYLRSVG
jgi:hypothetical protein